MAPLDPWIIEEILRREREKKEEQDRTQIEISIERPGDEKPGHEMPSERKPGYEMPNPNEPVGPPAEKKDDDGERRGVDISRIGGDGDGDEDDDGSITIDISRIPPAFPEEEKKKEEKRPE